MIRKSGSGYKVYSERGKPLSRTYQRMSEAKKRLAQIEYFKHKKGSR